MLSIYNSNPLINCENTFDNNTKLLEWVSVMNTRLLCVSGCMFFMFTAASLGQGTFQNGTFEQPGVNNSDFGTGFGPGSTYITGWTTVPGYGGGFVGTVEYLKTRGQPAGGYCVELGYYLGTNAIQQTFSTLANQAYRVSFWLATDPFNGPPAVLRVSAAGSFADYQAPARTGSEQAMGWQLQTFSFTSDNTGSTTLWLGNMLGVAAIDSINVTPVPEPCTVELVGLGLLVRIVTARRRSLERA